MKRKRLIKEIIVLGVTVGLIILSLIYTCLPIGIDIINTRLQYSDQLDLLFTLFGIQATIATLSISIIAIITGFQSKSVHGVSVTHYVTSLKPCIFKHKVLMIADLVITVINYFLVAFKLFNTSISFFIISVIISCILIIDTSFVFKKSSTIYQEIGEFLLENYTIDSLHDLELSINEHINSEHTSELEIELEFINILLESELGKTAISKDNIDYLEKVLVNCYLNAYLSNNKEMVLSILKEIDNFYVTANNAKGNDNSDPYPVDIWSSIYLQYFTFLSTISLSQLQNYRKFDYLEFKLQMYQNLVFESENNEVKQKNNFLLEYYYAFVYWRVVVGNSHDEDYSSVKERVINDAYLNAFWNKEDNKNKAIINIKAICYLLKAFIENGEIDLLKSDYLKRLRYQLNDPKNAYVFLITVIYAYYLTYNEPIVEGTNEQKNATEYLNVIKGSIINAIYEMDIISVLKNSIISIHSLIDNWEKFENGVAKAVALEPAITDVLFFFSISKYYDEERLSECFKLISNNNVDSLILTYFSPDVFYDRYSVFQKRFFNITVSQNDERYLVKKSLVRGALSRERKKEMIEKAFESPITDEISEKIVSKYKKVFEDESQKYNVFVHEGFTKTKHKSTSTKITILDEYDCLIEANNEYINKTIAYIIYWYFIRSINQHLNVESISFHSKQKQDILINLARNICPDTFIGNRETFWEEDDKDKLNRFTKDMYKIDNPFEHNTLLLINSQMIHLKFSNVSFNTNDCSPDDFKDLNIEFRDGKYYYSRYSNVMKVPFEKDELLEYLKKTRKVLILSFDIEYAVKNDTVGCGIIIEYSDQDD